jgi:hypothetical protein
MQGLNLQIELYKFGAAMNNPKQLRAQKYLCAEICLYQVMAALNNSKQRRTAGFPITCAEISDGEIKSGRSCGKFDPQEFDPANLLRMEHANRCEGWITKFDWHKVFPTENALKNARKICGPNAWSSKSEGL